MLSLRGRTPSELPRLPKKPRHRIAEEKERKKNEKKKPITPEPPKVNFWEQRAKQPHSANSPPQPTNRNPYNYYFPIETKQ
ncbi:hypothetical protein TNCV_2880701 [Trichonephila clavipes]|nr:hypothetical protein TNCV_2880701 [Trichonephila clavipes]